MKVVLIIKYVVIYFLLLFIETNLLHLISIKNITPDLILVYVLLVSMREKRNKVVIVGFASGLIQDVFTTKLFGLFALSKTITGFLGGFFQQRRIEYKLLYLSAVFFVLIFIHELIYQIIYSLGGDISFSTLLFYSIIPRTIYTLAVAVIFYLIINLKSLGNFPT